MPKKRKASGRNAQPSGPRELDPADARLGPIATFEDVANSEDEFFLNQGTILLDDEPQSKRRRKDEADMELSDEEVLGYDDEDDEDDDDDDDDDEEDADMNGASTANGERDEGEEEGASGWWGSSRKEYYNADDIENEADAMEEEVEAKRIQQKKLSKMAEEDFMFDGDAWLTTEIEPDDNEEAFTEVLKDIEITEDMGPSERHALLLTRYPEFEHLVGELQDLQPVLDSLRLRAVSKSSNSLEALKYWVLGCYVAALASYLAILTSPARDSAKVEKPLDPTELRDHDVMETLVRCRGAWQRIRNIKTAPMSAESSPTEVVDAVPGTEGALIEPKKTKKIIKQERADEKKKTRKLQRAKAIEDTVADLYDLPLGPRTSQKPNFTPVTDNDGNSDFGEEAVLDARTAADKAQRKKSLKFYTSEIVQKANRRAGAGRDAGGDMDIPHRERLRDRQARLLAQAERRGKSDSKHGADLGDDSGEEDMTVADAIRNSESAYYDTVAQSSKTRKDVKAARYAAYASVGKADRVVEKEEVGPDGKRKVTYAIQKNKGLAPKRRKDVRNPRVKKRKQFEAKQKKLRSMKPTWKGGEPKGGYHGELAGINTSVIKSVKL